VPYTLVLLRHGQSTWNLENRFTGWVDVDLSDEGAAQAIRAGEDLADAGITPDVVHTSLQRRAIHTAELTLGACARSWIPVRRSWRLNERHYGALQGKNKADTAREFSPEQVKIWRRSYDVAPDPLAIDDPLSGIDERYASLPPDVLPRSECLKDVVERMLPWWEDAIVPDLRSGATVLVAAHGNSLRGLVKHLDGLSSEAVVALDVPTAEVFVYDLDENLQPPPTVGPGGMRARYLNPDRAVAAADAVAHQAG